MSGIHCFIGPQEIILVLAILPVILFLLLIILVIKSLRGNGNPQKVAKELEKEFNK